MLAIEVNFLTGRYVAAAHHNRKATEWPPHPARFFSALVATWADADHPDPTERRALEWLEEQPPPAIHAPDAVARKVVSHFVPVNDATVISPSPYFNRYEKITSYLEETVAVDKSDPKGARRLKTLTNLMSKQRDVRSLTSKVGVTTVESAVDIMPPGWLTHVGAKKTKGKETTVLISRTGQPREYPSVTPLEPRVVYLWSNHPPHDLETALNHLLSRVTRLGHSSSLVSCRLNQDRPAATHVPGDGGTVLRTVRKGQLKALEMRYAQHQACKPRHLPFVSTAYRSTADQADESQPHRPDTAGELLIFEFRPKSRRIPSTRVAELTAALRATVFRYAQDPLPEGLSGHRDNGLPSTHPHVGFLGLPWVQQQHSDGRLMGLAISIPHSLDGGSRSAVYRAVGEWETQASAPESPLRLTLGRGGVLDLHRVLGISDLITLRPEVWHRPSRRWVSVTPIALPRHPGTLGKGTSAARTKAWKRAEQAIEAACHHIGLSDLVNVTLSLEPLMPGVRPARQFPTFRQTMPNGKPVARRLIHASISLDQPVRGPLVLGAGRYLGLGMMRPAPQENTS